MIVNKLFSNVQKYNQREAFFFNWQLILTFIVYIYARSYTRKDISEVCACFVLQCLWGLGGNVNTRQMAKSDVGSIFHIQNQRNILVIGNYYVNYQNYQNLMLLTSMDTKRSLMHLFLFTNSVQRELVSICAQSIHNCN